MHTFISGKKNYSVKYLTYSRAVDIFFVRLFLAVIFLKNSESLLCALVLFFSFQLSVLETSCISTHSSAFLFNSYIVFHYCSLLSQFPCTQHCLQLVLYWSACFIQCRRNSRACIYTRKTHKIPYYH